MVHRSGMENGQGAHHLWRCDWTGLHVEQVLRIPSCPSDLLHLLRPAPPLPSPTSNLFGPGLGLGLFAYRSKKREVKQLRLISLKISIICLAQVLPPPSKLQLCTVREYENLNDY